MKYKKRLHSPQFRDVFLLLDPQAQMRVADWVFQLQRGEVEGVANGEAWEVQTEAGEIITYEIKRETLFLLDLHI